MVAPAAPSTAETTATSSLALPRTFSAWLPIAVTAIAFVLLFLSPARGLSRDWIHDDDSSYGLLLFPVSLWLAWRAGLVANRAANIRLGTVFLVSAVVLRCLGSLAAELFTQRVSIWLAIVGLIVYTMGPRQARHWWLPLILLGLSIPLPALLTNWLALPLQNQASHLGTALIRWRHIDVRLAGNVITIPGEQLFVAEACSGLRSLTALLSLGVMVGGLWLRSVPARLALLLISIPVAVLVNGVRVFLTAFLMYFVDRKLGQGFMHESQGWGLFLVSLALLTGITFVVRAIEDRFMPEGARDA